MIKIDLLKEGMRKVKTFAFNNPNCPPKIRFYNPKTQFQKIASLAT